MHVAESVAVFMRGIATMDVLEGRLGESQDEARNDSEMKQDPHEASLYTACEFGFAANRGWLAETG